VRNLKFRWRCLLIGRQGQEQASRTIFVAGCKGSPILFRRRAVVALMRVTVVRVAMGMTVAMPVMVARSVAVRMFQWTSNAWFARASLDMRMHMRHLGRHARGKKGQQDH
jgi:hypothetical protein